MKRLLVTAIAVVAAVTLLGISAAQSQTRKKVIRQPDAQTETKKIVVQPNVVTVQLWCKALNPAPLAALETKPVDKLETGAIVKGPVRIFEIDTSTCDQATYTCQPKQGGYFKYVECPKPPAKGTVTLSPIIVQLPKNKVYWVAGWSNNAPAQDRGAFMEIANLKSNISRDLNFVWPFSQQDKVLFKHRFDQVMSWPMPGPVLIQ